MAWRGLALSASIAVLAMMLGPVAVVDAKRESYLSPPHLTPTLGAGFG